MSSSSAYAALQSTRYNYINKATAYMREAPESNGVGVSEARFGQAVEILEEFGEWTQIMTLTDNYTGWVEASAVHSTNISYLENPGVVEAKVTRCRANIYSIGDTERGPILTLPYDARLEVHHQVDNRWVAVTLPDQRTAFVQRGDVELDAKLLSRAEMVSLAVRLENKDIPFTWGGTTTFGFDSSGLVQMLYQQMGVFLPRDSKDQYTSEHLTSKNLDALESGDLIFFGDDEAHVRYVGMYLGNHEFVHCGVSENMPYLRVSKLSDTAWDGSTRLHFRAGKTLANASEERVAS